MHGLVSLDRSAIKLTHGRYISVVWGIDSLVMATANIERFYEYVKDEGELFNRVTFHRAFIFDAESWHIMARGLAKAFSSKTEPIMFEAGKAYGKNVIRTALERTKDRTELLNYLSDLASASGWGVFRLQLWEHLLVIESENYALADKAGGRDEPSCYFLKGVFQGISEVLFGKEATTAELLCRSKGDDNCKFEVYF